MILHSCTYRFLELLACIQVFFKRKGRSSTIQFPVRHSVGVIWISLILQNLSYICIEMHAVLLDSELAVVGRSMYFGLLLTYTVDE